MKYILSLIITFFILSSCDEDSISGIESVEEIEILNRVICDNKFYLNIKASDINNLDSFHILASRSQSDFYRQYNYHYYPNDTLSISIENNSVYFELNNDWSYVFVSSNDSLQYLSYCVKTLRKIEKVESEGNKYSAYIMNLDSIQDIDLKVNGDIITNIEPQYSREVFKFGGHPSNANEFYFNEGLISFNYEGEINELSINNACGEDKFKYSDKLIDSIKIIVNKIEVISSDYLGQDADTLLDHTTQK